MGAILVFACGIFALVGAIAIPMVYFATSSFVGSLIFLLIAAALLIQGSKLIREAFPGRCHLALTPDALVLRHTILLRKELRLPLDTVDRVGVVASGSDRFWRPESITLEKEKKGIVWTASVDETAEVLDFHSRVMLPIASHIREEQPNVAVVLKEPVDVRSLRRKRAAGKNVLFLRLNDVDSTAGFFACVKDPQVFARVLESRGLLGRLSDEHVDLITPSPEDERRIGGALFARLVGGVLMIIFLVAKLWEALHNWSP